MNKIDIVSIDNVTEPEGQEQVAGLIATLEQGGGRLIAVLPEYGGSRLHRLDVLIAPADDAAYASTKAEYALLLAIAGVVSERKAAHDAAIAALDRPMTVTHPADTE